MKIPKKAKKVFEGVMFNVYHWQQEMFDGSYETFEMLERQSTVDVLPIVGENIIILNQEQPRKSLFTSMVGGRIEKGEKVLKAAEREMMEETGYGAEKFEIIDKFFGSTKIYWPEYLVVARDCKKVAKQELDAGEKIEIKLVDFDGFLNLVRDKRFAAPWDLKFKMYEALIDANKKEDLRKKLFLG